MGQGENDSGNTDVIDTDCGTGLTTVKCGLFWHLGASKVPSSDKTPTEMHDLVYAAVHGTDAELDTQGLALFGGFWQDHVIDKAPAQGDTISVREGMRRTLVRMASPLVAI